MSAPRPLILTLAFDEDSFAIFDGLRRRHFPPERNHIPAHLTLFHHLPGEREDEVLEVLREACAEVPPMTLAVTGLRSLGRGVAFTLEGAALGPLRARIAAPFAEALTPQDRQSPKPHVTIQNKVEPADARALLEELSRDFRPFTVQGEGLLLWRYLGGPWERVARVPFGG